MMFSRVYLSFVYFFVALATLATAMPGGEPPVTTTVTVTAPASTSSVPASSCSTGPIQCCQTVESANSDGVSTLLGLLGIVLSDLNVLVGLNCDSILGSTCDSTAVCCENNSVGSLISIGCLPVIL